MSFSTASAETRPGASRRASRVALVVASSLLALSALPATADEGSVAASVAGAAPEATATLDALLARLSRVGSFQARFREEKRLALLRSPLVNEGQVWFARPGWMLRRTERPESATVLLRDGVLTVRDPGGQHRIELAESPILRGFVETFAHVLAGDRKALERLYHLELRAQDTAQGWELSLLPRDATLTRFVRQLWFRGVADRVEAMRLVEANGDETRMEFSAIQLGPIPSPAEKQRLFSMTGD